MIVTLNNDGKLVPVYVSWDDVLIGAVSFLSSDTEAMVIKGSDDPSSDDLERFYALVRFDDDSTAWVFCDHLFNQDGSKFVM